MGRGAAGLPLFFLYPYIIATLYTYMSTLGLSTDGIATIYNNATTRNDHHTIIPLTQNVTIPLPH